MRELSRFNQFCIQAEEGASGKDESCGLSSGALKTIFKVIQALSFPLNGWT